MNLRSGFAAALAAAALVPIAPALAAPADLDGSFGSGGVTKTALGDPSLAQDVVDQGGKLLVAGSQLHNSKWQWVVGRYTADGALDPDFNGGALENFAGQGLSFDQAGPARPIGGATAVVAEPSGSIDVGGQTTGTNAPVAVLHMSGAGVASGVSSIAVTNSADTTVRAMALQPDDGKLVVAGEAFIGGHPTPFVARFLTNGAPDGSFATNGLLLVSPCDDALYATQDCSEGGLALATSGGAVSAIYVGGFAEGSLTGRIWRLAPNGGGGTFVPDTSFGSGGAAQFDRSVVSEVDALLLAGGNVVAVGYANNGANSKSCTIARVSASSGAVDLGFGSRIDVGGTCTARDVALDAAGRYVFTGESYSGTQSTGTLSFAVGRWTAAGAADTTFAAGGGTAISPGGTPAFGEAILMQGDKPIVAGGAGDPTHDLTIARLAGGALSAPAGGGSDTTPTPTPTPKGSGPVLVVGNPTVGETLFCDPGGAKGTLDYTWFMIGKDGSGANSPIGRQQTFKLTETQVGFGVECFVHAAGTGQGLTSDNRPIVLERKVEPFVPSFTKALRNYLRGTRICGSKGYCTAEQVRQDLIAQGVNLVFPDPKTVEHRSQLPKGLRNDAQPGEVIAVRSAPGNGVRYTTGPTKPVTVHTTIFDPVIPSKTACPFNADLITVGDRDFQLPDLLVGLSYREAKALLKKEHCFRVDADGDETRVEYEIEAEKTGKVGDPVVTAARVVKDKNAPRKKLVALTITRPPAELGLLIGGEYPNGAVSIGLGDRSLTVGKGVTTAFNVTVTYNGIGFKNAKVELRDPDGIVVDNELTDASGIAHFNVGLTRAGRYELWASVEDKQGDNLVGYETRIPGIARRGASFIDAAGFTWATKDGKYTPQALTGRATVAAADPDVERVKAIAKTMLQSLTVHWIPLIIDQTVQFAVYGDKATVDASLASMNAMAFALGSLAQTGCLPCVAQYGVSFPVLTFGGSSPSIGAGTTSVLQGLSFNGRSEAATKTTGVVPGDGALAVRAGNVVMLADGTYIVATGGGTIISNDGGSVQPAVVDASKVALTPSVLGGYIVSTSGSGIISNDGGSLAAKGGAIVAVGGGNLISANSGKAIATLGASIIADNGGGFFSDNGTG